MPFHLHFTKTLQRIFITCQLELAMKQKLHVGVDD